MTYWTHGPTKRYPSFTSCQQEVISSSFPLLDKRSRSVNKRLANYLRVTQSSIKLKRAKLYESYSSSIKLKRAIFKFSRARTRLVYIPEKDLLKL